MPETDHQIGCAFDLSEPLPTTLDWGSALGAVFRRDFDGATVQHVLPLKRGVQVRVAFGSPMLRGEAPQVEDMMRASATELASRMRQLEEDTTLGDFERIEKEYRGGVTVYQRGQTLLAGAKTTAEVLAAGKEIYAGLKSVASVVLPPHLSGMLP